MVTALVHENIFLLSCGSITENTELDSGICAVIVLQM